MNAGEDHPSLAEAVNDLGLTTAVLARIVQALHWLKDTLLSDRDLVQARLSALLMDPKRGAALRDDLRQGMTTRPAWMQTLVKLLLADPGAASDRVG